METRAKGTFQRSLKGITMRDAARDFRGLSYNGYERNLSVTAASAIVIYPRERT